MSRISLAAWLRCSSRSGHRHGARLRLHQRLPRHGQRDGHVDRHATTIAEDIVDAHLITLEVLFAGLVGAILRNLVTWAASLPSSSSHALIGGVVGAALVAKGGDAVKSDGLFSEVIIPAVLAPVILAAVGLVTAYGGGVMALDRLDRSEAAPGARLGWTFALSLAALACLGLLAVGFWAMTQK